MNDVASMLRLTSAGARALVAVCVISDLVLALATIDHVRTPLVTLLSWVLVAVVSFSLTRSGPAPMELWRAVVTIAGTTTVAFLGDWNMYGVTDGSYATWHFGALTLVFIVLALWDRLAIAWIGFGLVVLVTAVWTVAIGHGNTFMLALLLNQAGSLVVGSAFAVILGRQSRRVTRLHAEHTALASAESAARAAAAERERQSVRLNEIARAALERIADDAPYTDDEREDWLRLEAAIRDGLRARSLDSLELAEAARRARERGVEVTLLDDSESDERSDTERDAITDALITELGRLESGRLIGRVLPEGRGHLATILIDGEDGSHQVEV